MSLILPSSAARAPSTTSSVNAATRYDEPVQNDPGSFGEALARSLEPAAEKADKPAAKAVAAQPARRQDDPEKPAPEDLVTAMGLLFTPLESRLSQALLPGGAGTPPGDSAEPASLTATLLTGTDNAVSAATTAVLLAGTDSATPASPTNGLPNALLASASPITDIAPEAAGVIVDTDAPATLAQALAVASPNSTGPATLQIQSTPVNDGALTSSNPSAIGAQTQTANAGLSDQTSKREDKGAHTPRESSAAQADLALTSPQDPVKAAASPAAPTRENAIPSISSPAAAEGTISVSTALPMAPAPGATVMQASLGVAAPNAPTSVASASLLPAVDSLEWSKALGQHVLQMGNAGHQVAELQLNPPGLGPLRVTLSVIDHQMQAMFVSAHSSVRAAVEAALPQLRTTLADSGISLGHTSVGAESQQQAAFTQHQSANQGRGAYRGSELAEDAQLLQGRPVTEPHRRSSAMGRIDTYA